MLIYIYIYIYIYLCLGDFKKKILTAEELLHLESFLKSNNAWKSVSYLLLLLMLFFLLLLLFFCLISI
jgi:hypothetical protein